MQLPQRRFSVGKIVLVTLLAAATLTSVAAKPAVLTLTSHDLPPYSYPSGEGSADGIAVRAVQCSARLVGVPVNIVFVPWKRAQLIVKNGGADGFFAASHKVVGTPSCWKNGKIIRPEAGRADTVSLSA